MNTLDSPSDFDNLPSNVENEDPSFQGIFNRILQNVFSLFLLCCVIPFEGFVIHKISVWFFTEDFPVRAISISSAIGLVLTAAVLRGLSKSEEDKYPTWLRALVEIIAAAWLLLWAWIIHHFIF